jgi:hypothetical protein
MLRKKKPEELPAPILDRATLYVMTGSSIFGYKTIEARDVRYEIGPFAQYENAITIDLTPKGARIPRKLTLTSPRLVILEGWGHPKAPNGRDMLEPTGDGMARVPTTFGPPEDDPLHQAFDKMLREYLGSSGAVLAKDFRGHEMIESR